MIKMTFTGIGLEEELLIIIFFWLMAVDETLGISVLLTGGPADHLQHVRNGVVHVAFLLAVVATRVHYHHAERLNAQVPRQFVGADYYLDQLRREQFLNDLAVRGLHSFVNHTDS